MNLGDVNSLWQQQSRLPVPRISNHPGALCDTVFSSPPSYCGTLPALWARSMPGRVCLHQTVHLQDHHAASRLHSACHLKAFWQRGNFFPVLLQISVQMFFHFYRHGFHLEGKLIPNPLNSGQIQVKLNWSGFALPSHSFIFLPDQIKDFQKLPWSRITGSEKKLLLSNF